jgi:hypothetical protein
MLLLHCLRKSQQKYWGSIMELLQQHKGIIIFGGGELLFVGNIHRIKNTESPENL